MLGVTALIDQLNTETEDKLKEFLAGFECYYNQKKTKAAYDLDVKFHYFLIESSKNKIIINLTEELNILLLCFTKGWVLDWDISIKQHNEIINLILAKDKNKAEFAIRNHINTLREEFIKKN
jgi:DNA-binding GntR family transcriptional regulator